MNQKRWSDYRGRMAMLVPITLHVDPEVATLLEHPGARQRAADAVREALRNDRAVQLRELEAALKACQEEAAASGLTEEEIEAELAAYNAERRDRPRA